MLRRSIVYVITLICAFNFDANAQKDIDPDSGPSFKDRIYTGGGLGFSSNSYATYISVSPLVGYMLGRKTSVGVGATYQYYNYKQIDADDNRYGGDIFLTQMIYSGLFAMAKYDFINMNRRPDLENYPRETFSRVLLGGGFSQPLGKAHLNIMALYDVTYDNGPNYPYSSPWVIGAFISI